MMVVVVLASGKTKLAVATTSNDYFALLSSASTGTREKSRLLRFLLHLFCHTGRVLANALKLAADFQDKKDRRGRVRILRSILRRLEKSRRAFYTSVINNRGKKGNKPFSRSC
jgi:hypothetical protein